MRQSNSYILIYSAILTIVCGGLLALTAEGLKDRQEANVELERKKNILATVIPLDENADIIKLYSERVKPFVIDFEGNVKEGMMPAQVSVVTEYKKPAEQRLLPVYEFRNPNNPDQVDNVVLPLFGYGLWNNIWGFIALESDLNTVKGINLQHAGETPGLGARITTEEIQDRYKGKKIFENGKLVSIVMMKGEGNDYSSDPHKVDGMSGATLTAKGVNIMLSDYLYSYQNYIKKKQSTAQAL